MKPVLNRAFDTFIDTILPPRCIVSGEIVAEQGMLAPSVWAQVRFIEGSVCESCGFPFDYEVISGSLCASCLDYPPNFASARASFVYDEASRDMILGFKHGDQTYAVKSFAPLMLRAGREFLNRADLLVPVPLHPFRLVMRRYNQAALLAQALSKQADIPACLDLLKRTRATQSQGHLNADERRKNVRKAFALNEKKTEQVKGKTIILIDDVYTTGATVKECTKALKRAGASEVHILTLARVAREGFG